MTIDLNIFGTLLLLTAGFVSGVAVTLTLAFFIRRFPMSTLAQISTRLDTVLTDAQALKSNRDALAANQLDQAAVDDIAAKVEAVAAVVAPTIAPPAP